MRASPPERNALGSIPPPARHVERLADQMLADLAKPYCLCRVRPHQCGGCLLRPTVGKRSAWQTADLAYLYAFRCLGGQGRPDPSSRKLYSYSRGQKVISLTA